MRTWLLSWHRNWLHLPNLIKSGNQLLKTGVKLLNCLLNCLHRVAESLGGTLFSADLVDERGVETRAVFFNKEVDQLASYHASVLFELWVVSKYIGSSCFNKRAAIWALYPGVCVIQASPSSFDADLAGFRHWLVNLVTLAYVQLAPQVDKFFDILQKGNLKSVLHVGLGIFVDLDTFCYIVLDCPTAASQLRQALQLFRWQEEAGKN